MPTRVLLLRHAESALPTVFHGAESDIGLSARGIRQADAVAKDLATTAPVAVVSSAMRRAVATAAPIAAACGLSLRIEHRLHERRVGSLSGTPFDAHEGAWPETLKRWMTGETCFAPEDAESFDAIRERVLPVWEQLTRDYHEQAFVIVAHGVVCKVLLLSLLPGWTSADWHRLGPSRNVGINEVMEENGAWKAIRLNDLPASVSSV